MNTEDQVRAETLPSALDMLVWKEGWEKALPLLAYQSSSVGDGPCTISVNKTRGEEK